MPFQSRAQVRKFYALKAKGEMDQATIDEWAHSTPDIKKLPERKKKLKKTAFWQGFMKAADGADGGMGDGGSGFTGVGKGNLIGSLEHDEYDGSKPASDEKPDGASDGMTDKSLLDRERNPRDFSPFNNGPELEDENGSHIRY